MVGTYDEATSMNQHYFKKSNKHGAAIHIAQSTEQKNWRTGITQPTTFCGRGINDTGTNNVPLSRIGTSAIATCGMCREKRYSHIWLLRYNSKWREYHHDMEALTGDLERNYIEWYGPDYVNITEHREYLHKRKIKARRNLKAGIKAGNSYAQRMWRRVEFANAPVKKFRSFVIPS